MIILLILIYVFIAYIHIPGLIKKKYWRDLAAFIVFMTVAFTLSLLYSLDVKILSPVKAIKSILDTLNLHY